MTPVRYADMHLGIVCPIANEEATLEAFVEEVLAVCGGFSFGEISFFLVIDRVSTDNSLDIVRRMAAAMKPVQCVWAPDNPSVADAYKRGYREAIQAECDWIMQLDAGFSHRPRDIPLFFKAMEAGKDCVFGSRFMRGGYFDKSFWKRYLVSRGGTLLVNLVLGTRMTDMTSSFECYKRPVLKEILAAGIQSTGPFVQTEIRVHAHRFDYAEVPIHYSSPSLTVRKGAISESLRLLWGLFKAKRGKGRSPQ